MKKIKKRIITAIFVVTMILNLAGCSKTSETMDANPRTSILQPDEKPVVETSSELNTQEHNIEQSTPESSVPKDLSDEETEGVPVNVIDLYNEFKKDQQAAANKYSGEIIEVKGVVVYKGPDIHQTPSIELSTSVDGKSYVLCVVNSFDQLDGISVGDTLVMSGNFHIFGSDDWVVLKQCEII